MLDLSLDFDLALPTTSFLQSIILMRGLFLQRLKPLERLQISYSVSSRDRDLRSNFPFNVREQIIKIILWLGD